MWYSKKSFPYFVCILFSIVYAFMSVMNLQVFFGGLLSRTGVVFTGEKNHVSKSLMQGLTITDGGFYSVLLNPATKLDSDGAEVKWDWCLLNFWLFVLALWITLDEMKTYQGLKTWWCHAGKIESKRKVCWWKMITEGMHYSSPENYYLFLGKKKVKGPHSWHKTNNEVSQIPLYLFLRLSEHNSYDLVALLVVLESLAMVSHYWQKLKGTETHEDA